MAGLRDASIYDAPATPSRFYDNVQVTSPDQAAALSATMDDPFTAGVRSGLRGTIGGLKGLAAGIQDAYGADPADMYAAAEQDARTAALIGPKVRALRDIHGPGDALAYGMGQAGTMAPFLLAGGVGGMAGRGANAALRVGLADSTAAHLGATAAFVPSMAGEQIAQMHELAPDMPADERLMRGLTTGTAQALVGAVPGSMLARLPAARPFWRGLGTQVAAGGAGMAGMDVVGQLNRMDYDPSYHYDPSATLEAAAAGAVGTAPFAVPHALAGSGAKAGADLSSTLGAGARVVGSKAYEALPEHARVVVDAYAQGRAKLGEVREALAPYTDLLGGASRAIYDTAAEGAADTVGTVQGALAGGGVRDAVAAGATKLQEHGNNVAAVAEGAAKRIADSEPVQSLLSDTTDAVKQFVSGSKGDSDAVSRLTEVMEDPGKWLNDKETMDPKKLKDILAKTDQPRLRAKYAQTVLSFLDSVAHDSAAAGDVRELAERMKAGDQLTNAEKTRLYAQTKLIARAQKTSEDLMQLLKFDQRLKTGQEQTGKLTPAQFSRQGDTINKTVREALSGALTDPAMVGKIANRVQTADVVRFGAERTVREAVDAVMSEYGIDPNTVRQTTLAVQEAVRAKLDELRQDGSLAKYEKEAGLAKTSEAFRQRVGEHLTEMFQSSDVGKELLGRTGGAGTEIKAMADFIAKLAEGAKGYGPKEAARLYYNVEKVFGEQGVAALSKIIGAAEAEFGGNARAFQRVSALKKDFGGLDSVLQEVRSRLKDKNADPDELLHDLETTKNFYANREEVERKAAALQARADKEANQDRAFELREQALALSEELDSSGVDALRDKWVEAGYTDRKGFNKLVDALEKYGQHDDRLTKMERRAPNHETSANHQAERDLEDLDAKEEAANYDEEGSGNDAEETAKKRLKEATGAEEEQRIKPSVWWGTNAFAEGGHDAGNIGAPLTRHPSGDYRTNQYSEAVANAHAKYGHRVTQGHAVRPLAWAEELAKTSGRTEYEHLDDAMQALLAHDQERLKNEKLTETDKHWIGQRAKLAEELLAAQEERGGIKAYPAAGHFFDHPMNKNYRYYKMEQHDASNLSYNRDVLEAIYSVHPDETAHSYAERMVQRDGPHAFDPKVYRDSLMPMVTADNKVMEVDVAKAVMDALRRHQAGDVSGLGEKDTVNLKQEILTAAHNVIGALMTAEGMHPKDPLGSISERGTTFTTDENIPAGHGARNKGNDNLHLDPNLVVYRDPTGRLVQELGEHVTTASVRRVYRLKDLTGIEGRDEATGRLKMEGSNVIMTPAGVRRMEWSPGVFSDRDIQGFTSVAERTGRREQKSVEAGNEKGVAYGGLEHEGRRVSADVHQLLNRMLERNGIDPHEALQGTAMPKELAGMLLREAFAELKSRGFTGDLLDLANGKYDMLVAYRQSYGEESYPVFFKDLKPFAHEQSQAKMPRNLEQAKLREALQLLNKAERDEISSIARVNRKAPLAGDMSPAMQKARADLVSKGLDRTEFAKGQPDESRPQEANKFDSADTENMRLRNLLKEFSNGGDAPLFDRSAHRIFLDADRALNEAQRRALRNSEREWEGQATSEDRAVLAEQEKRALAEAKAAIAKEISEHLKERDELATPAGKEGGSAFDPAQVKKPETPYEAPKIGDELKANAKMQSTEVRTNESELIGQALREESRAVQRRRAAAEETARLRAATKDNENVVAYSSDKGYTEKAPERQKQPTLSAKKDERIDPWQTAKDFAGREATRIGESRETMEKMSDAELTEFALALPKLRAEDDSLAAQATRILSAEKGSHAEWAAKARERAGVVFNRRTGAFEEKGEAQYSRAQKGEAGPATREEREQEMRNDLGRMLKDAFGLEFKADLRDKEGTPVSGMFDGEKMILDALSEKDVLHHEVWHGVEKVLKGMGEKGEAILTQLDKHFDTPFMRRWIAEQLAGDEGATKQLADPRERAAFIFQKFMAGEKMPLVDETRGMLTRLKDWVVGMARKVGGWVGLDSHTDAQKAQSFFEYVKNGDFARDMENADSVRSGLGEGKGDRLMATAAKVLKPALDGLDAVVGHTVDRVHALNVPEYSDITRLYGGETGKGGYSGDRQGAINMFANDIGEQIKHLNEEGKKEFFSSDKFSQFLGRVEDYMKGAGVPEKVMDGMYDRLDTYNSGKVGDSIEEFITDLVKYGGLKGDKAGEARQIANQIADKGYYFDPDRELFKDNPRIKEKWLERDMEEKLSRYIERASYYAEQYRHFGDEDGMRGKLDKMLADGDAKASGDAKKLMRDYIAAQEGTLGVEDMSPGMKKFMSSLLFANNVRILPKAVFSQMLEPMQLGLRRNSMHGTLDALFRGIRDMPRSWDWADKLYTPDKWEKLANQIGSAPSRIIANVMTQMMNGVEIKGRIGWLNDKFFQYNFMDQWNRSMHVEATKHAAEFLIEHSTSDADLSRRLLGDLGLEKGDIKTNRDGELVLNDKVVKAIRQYVNEAMAHPDANSNPLWMNDPRFALLSQMKRFTFAHSKYILERGIREYKLGNAFPVVPALIAMPWMAAADGLRDTLTGTDTSYKNNWTMWDYAKHAYERAGHAGRGQFLADVDNSLSHGGNGLDAVAGPTAELFGRIARGAHTGHLLDSLIENAPGGPMIMPD